MVALLSRSLQNRIDYLMLCGNDGLLWPWVKVEYCPCDKDIIHPNAYERKLEWKALRFSVGGRVLYQ